MDCLDEQTMLDFLAGRLDGATTARAREHVAKCEACNAIATELIQGAAAHMRAPESTSYELVPGAVIAGKYRLVREIGQGGMGVVWEASPPVAIKFLKGFDASAKNRFLREVKIAKSLACVPRVIEVLPDVEAGVPALVMELLVGRPLAKTGARPPREARRIAWHVANALAEIHRAGLVHRDVKPANIFLLDDSERPVVLLDLGLAKDTSGLRTKITRTGQTVGTPAYMAPEQLAGDPSIDGRADLWSLGVVLYEMLQGKKPIAGAPLDLSGIDAATAALLRSLLDPDRSARPASAELVAGALARIDPDG